MVARLALFLLALETTHAFIRPLSLLTGRRAPSSAPIPPLGFVGSPLPSRHLTFLQATSEGAALPEVDLDPADPDADPVVLRDVATNRAIECFLHSYCTVTGEADKFVVGIPVDPCVDICEVDAKTEELITLDPDSQDMDAIFPVAAALLAEDDLTLLRSATTVTLQGDLDLSEDEDDEDDNDEFEEFPPDKELASFEHEGRTYCMIVVGMPLLLIAKAAAESKSEYVLLNDGENERVATAIQAQLDAEFDIQIEEDGEEHVARG